MARRTGPGEESVKECVDDGYCSCSSYLHFINVLKICFFWFGWAGLVVLWPFSVKESRCLFCKLKKFKTCKLMWGFSLKVHLEPLDKARTHNDHFSVFFSTSITKCLHKCVVFSFFLDSKTDLDITMLITGRMLEIIQNIRSFKFPVAALRQRGTALESTMIPLFILVFQETHLLGCLWVTDNRTQTSQRD